jgi:uncharacterized protein YbbK (DUF523 family)
MKVLISACLLGEKVRYDGSDNALTDKRLQDLELIACCPEVDGGLPVPRIPAEIYHDSVMNQEGKDVTKAFKKGANRALWLVKEHHIKVAIMKANSPSCSNENIYDGTFSKQLTAGKGIAVQLLEKEGVKVFNETQLNEAFAYITTLV